MGSMGHYQYDDRFHPFAYIYDPAGWVFPKTCFLFSAMGNVATPPFDTAFTFMVGILKQEIVAA